MPKLLQSEILQLFKCMGKKPTNSKHTTNMPYEIGLIEN